MSLFAVAPFTVRSPYIQVIPEPPVEVMVLAPSTTTVSEILAVLLPWEEMRPPL